MLSSTVTQAGLETLIEWVVSIIAFVLFLGFLYVIGQTGTTTRRGVELTKALAEANREADRGRGPVDPTKYRRLQSKAKKMIFLPIIFWIVLYTAVFFLCPLQFALYSLLLLIAPVLGYFGIFFMPDIEPH
jgi:uncharacterized membrane protein